MYGEAGLASVKEPKAEQRLVRHDAKAVTIHAKTAIVGVRMTVAMTIRAVMIVVPDMVAVIRQNALASLARSDSRHRGSMTYCKRH